MTWESPCPCIWALGRELHAQTKIRQTMAVKLHFFGKSNFPPKAMSLRKQSRISLRVGRSNSTSRAIWLLIYYHQENTCSSEDSSLRVVLSLASVPWGPGGSVTLGLQLTVLKSTFPMLNRNNALGGLLSGAISGSSKIPLVQKLWGRGGQSRLFQLSRTSSPFIWGRF